MFSCDGSPTYQYFEDGKKRINTKTGVPEWYREKEISAAPFKYNQIFSDGSIEENNSSSLCCL